MTDVNLNGNTINYGINSLSINKTADYVQSDNSSVVIANENKKSNSEESAVYEKSNEHSQNSVYSLNKKSAEERATIIQKLKSENEARVNQLMELINRMLTKQAGVSKLSELFSPENLANVSEADILQAKQDISEDGYWGVKQTSQRMFDFACALAGDDADKMKEMQSAMMKGFEQAKTAWGDELPSICQDTIDAANKLFEDYYASKGE